MTDEHLDRLVRDADPYRPELIGRLDGADGSLLEEIMSVPPRPRMRPSTVRRFAGALVAASLVTGVLAVSTMPDADQSGHRAAPAVPSEAPVVHGSGPAATAMVYSAAVLKAAEANPRLLIDQPGWTATTVYGFTKQTGTIEFEHGPRRLTMTWYPADGYDSYYQDRLAVSRPEAVQVDGGAGSLFRYSDNDFAVMLRPRDGAFAELRTGGAWTRTAFDKVIAEVVRVDVPTWLAALPPEIVTPGRAQEAADKVLAGIPLPPGFDRAALAGLGINDPYQFGAEVSSLVGCGWMTEWLRAKEAGDPAALQRASAALRGSHQWAVLQRMEGDGQWSEVFWETADGFVAGHPSRGYASAIGCD
jgi:hypothetical protein